MTTPKIVVDKITKRFRQGESHVTALSGVSLSIDEGELVAIMGASGSGKSTLLNLVAGLTSPSEGRVVVDGRDLAGKSDRELTLFRRRRVGLVFQAYNLIPSLTAEENILLPLYAEGGRRGTRPAELENLLEMLDIAGRRQHRPLQLSGGEQQRVAIARALVTEPAIVLADEPTGNLDSVSGQVVCKRLRELNERQRRTIVVVTHDPSVAIWASRIVVLKDGQVCADFASREFGTSHELAAHYHQLTESERESHARV